MRGATECARRLKPLLRSLRTKLGKVARPATGDPIKQMILGIFSRDVPESKALEALDRLRGLVVDYNELRVVPPIEMTEMVGALPNARLKCEDLSRALNRVFSFEHEVTLDRLASLPKREVIAYLDGIDGLDAYSRARIRLLGLQQHAIPFNEAMWAYARKVGLVDQKCSLEDAQAFLERRVSESEALEFVALVEKQAWAEVGAAVRNGEVERISSVPPDRTARNMLQLVTGGRGSGGAGDESDETEPAATETGPSADDATADAERQPAKPRVATGKKERTAKRPRVSNGTKAKAKAKAKIRVKTKAKSKPKTAPAAKSKKQAKPSATRKRKPTVSAKSKSKKAAQVKSTKQARRSAAKVKSA